MAPATDATIDVISPITEQVYARTPDGSPADIDGAVAVDGYGATSVSDVECNNGEDPEIKKGGTVTCDVVVDGRKRTVLVVFQDDNGSYEVDRPR